MSYQLNMLYQTLLPVKAINAKLCFKMQNAKGYIRLQCCHLNHRNTEKPRAPPPVPSPAQAVPPVADPEDVEDIEVPAVTCLQHHGTDRVTHPGVTCFKCDKKGHYAPECPDSETDDTVIPATTDIHCTVTTGT